MVLRIIFLLSFICHSICVYAQESVEVELVCPENVTINCESDLEEISTYGSATYRVGEAINDMENQRSKKNIDECGKGSIERIWRYKSEEGEEHKCSQFIYIGVDEAGRSLINWPTKEVIVPWCDPSYTPLDLPKAAQRPSYHQGECSKMEHTYSDEIVYISDSCKEVHRNWVVHDWCYDSKSIAGNDGHYEFTQVIKFEITNEIDLLALKDVTVVATDCEKAIVDMLDLKASLENCNRRIKIFNNSPFAESNGKNASGTYPIGETEVTYLIELECTPPIEVKQQVIVTNPCDANIIIEEQELRQKLNQSFVRPNPFTSETEIILTSANDQDAVIKIYNTKGKQISEQKIGLKSGMQRILITPKDLPLPGVYVYTVLIGDKKLEGKLIKIK